MNLAELNLIANRMVAKGKGCSPPTNPPPPSRSGSTRSTRRNTEDNRRDYREFLFRTMPAMKEHISGVILYEGPSQKAKGRTR